MTGVESVMMKAVGFIYRSTAVAESKPWGLHTFFTNPSLCTFQPCMYRIIEHITGAYSSALPITIPRNVAQGMWKSDFSALTNKPKGTLYRIFLTCWRCYSRELDHLRIPYNV